jgi:hypothetical protein
LADIPFEVIFSGKFEAELTKELINRNNDKNQPQGLLKEN